MKPQESPALRRDLESNKSGRKRGRFNNSDREEKDHGRSERFGKKSCQINFDREHNDCAAHNGGDGAENACDIKTSRETSLFTRVVRSSCHSAHYSVVFSFQPLSACPCQGSLSLHF